MEKQFWTNSEFVATNSKGFLIAVGETLAKLKKKIVGRNQKIILWRKAKSGRHSIHQEKVAKTIVEVQA